MAYAEAGSGDADVGNIYLAVQTRSVFACLLHWVTVTAVVILVITGTYIGYPQYYYGRGEAFEAFAMADIRYYHFISADALIAAVMLRFYLAFTATCNRDIMQFIPTPSNVIGAAKLAFYYLTFYGKHAHYRFINPLGGLGVFMMAGLFVIQTVTGVAMYAHGADPCLWGWAGANWLVDSVGGAQNVRLLHSLSMYMLIFTVIVHVYMQIWKTSLFAEGDIASIIGGYKIFRYEDIGHFADRYGIRLTEQPPSKEKMAKASHAMPEGPGQRAP
ncbi:MAG: Ni/Fe-hydrogenase, b-type cytochrome subunit [Nitrospinae bacterium]|nr:Ni/Fe-hydrogenase, b-type cytochrome subunit [Nitrospinota bacterium]